MATRPRVLLDVDGPIADFMTPALDAIHRVTGRRFKAEEHTSGWDLFAGLGLSSDEIDAVLLSMQTPGLCLGIPTVDGAREGVEELRSFADVWAVTSPFGGEHWMHERDAWLVKHMGFKKKDVLHVRAESKHGVFGDILVEDKIDTLQSWRMAWPDSHPVLFELSYNSNHGWDGLSVSGWGALVLKARALLT